MPKAILALRSYPLAILMALVLFVCSFLIATSSIGTIGGGGDDSGSGMGGTGRTGGLSGDSGFGGTGGPSPFLGNTDAAEQDAVEDSAEVSPSDSLVELFLQQQQETARIPEDMQPLIELQRTTPQRPDFEDSAPSLDILDEDRQQQPPHVRRLLDMAEANNNFPIVEPALEIQVQIPEATGTDTIEPFRLEVAEPATPLMFLESESDADEQQMPDDHSPDSSRPLIPERIQRPELPPFQRMRPAVDRASITPPRPRPMQI